MNSTRRNPFALALALAFAVGCGTDGLESITRLEPPPDNPFDPSAGGGGGGSPAAFVGPTAGYLASFPIVAALAGLLPRARTPVGHAMGFAGFLGLHVVILAMGWAWLSRLIGAEAAFASGVVPFLIGSVVKAGLASAILAALPAAWRRA